MKEFIPAAWDDLILAEEGTKVAADVTVSLVYKGHDLELDLTAAHAEELDRFLARYMRAARSPRGRPQGNKSPDPGNVTRYKAIRQFAEEHGLSYKTTTGKLYYDGALNAAFDAYVAGGDWAAVYDNWQPKSGRRVRKERVPVHEERGVAWAGSSGASH